MTITIRAAEPEDFEAIREVMSQPLAQKYTLQLPFPSLDMWKKRMANMPEGDHSLVAEMDGKIVGNFGLHSQAKSARRRHIGYVGMSVHDAWHRRGVGDALLRAGIDLGENWLQYTRLELTVFVDNEGALALYKKHGFEIEGTLRRYGFREGKFVDAYMMSRLKPV